MFSFNYSLLPARSDVQEPDTIFITITTIPADLPFEVDNEQYTSPYTFSWFQGEEHELSALSYHNLDTEIRYEYDYWDDGGEQTHDYTVPGYNDTLTIYYIKQYKLTVFSAHGNPQGDGWYDAGNSAYFSVTSPE
ncbi:MAG: hypothetical protein P8078_08565, partial [bacterium]